VTGTHATVAAQAGECPRRRGGAALAFVVAMLAVVAGQLVSTTATSAVPYLYDAPAVARVDDRTFAAAETASALLNGVQGESVLPSATARGPYTMSVAM
jgi:hypothetical protein